MVLHSVFCCPTSTLFDQRLSKVSITISWRRAPWLFPFLQRHTPKNSSNATNFFFIFWNQKMKTKAAFSLNFSWYHKRDQFSIENVFGNAMFNIFKEAISNWNAWQCRIKEANRDFSITKYQKYAPKFYKTTEWPLYKSGIVAEQFVSKKLSKKIEIFNFFCSRYPCMLQFTSEFDGKRLKTYPWTRFPVY